MVEQSRYAQVIDGTGTKIAQYKYELKSRIRKKTMNKATTTLNPMIVILRYGHILSGFPYL